MSKATIASMAPVNTSSLPRLRDRPRENDNPFHLRLAHLFLWTATTAVALFLLRPTFEITGSDSEGRERHTHVARAVVTVAAAPAYGIAILVTAMGLWSALRDRSSIERLEPGHWLLVIIGLAFLGLSSLHWLIVVFERGPRASLPPVATIMIGLAFAVAFLPIALALFVLLLACFEFPPSVWRLTFRVLGGIVLAMFLAMPAAYRVSPFVGLLFMLAVVGLVYSSLAMALVTDAQLGRRRDLAHWLGVAAAFAVVVHLVALVLIAV